MIRLLLLYVLLILSFALHSQPAADNNCSLTDFYALRGNDVHRLQMNATSVSDLGAVTIAAGGTINSLAIGDDITSGSANRTYYTSTSSGLSPCYIMRYTGTDWDTITSDPLVYHQAGGYGPYIYFMRSATNGQPNDQKIARLLPNGTLSTIFSDTSLMFTVADLAVDAQGQIYCFRGTAIGSTTELTVLSPSGQIVTSYSTNLNNLSTLYGMMFLNDTLYVGWGTTNGEIFPVAISGSTATLGTGRPVPAGVSYKDLANCYPAENQTGLSENEPGSLFNVYPVPARDHVTLESHLPAEFTAKIFAYDGRLIQHFNLRGLRNEIRTSHLKSGLYILYIEDQKGNRERLHLMKE